MSASLEDYLDLVPWRIILKLIFWRIILKLISRFVKNSNRLPVHAGTLLNSINEQVLTDIMHKYFDNLNKQVLIGSVALLLTRYLTLSSHLHLLQH